MKNFLRLLLIVLLLNGYEAYAVGTMVPGTLVVQPTVTKSAAYYRWRQDVNSLGNSGWLTASTTGVTSLDPINANTVYRIRMGVNFKVTLQASADYTYTLFLASGSGNTGLRDVHIQSFTLIPYIRYRAQYSIGTDTSNLEKTWTDIPDTYSASNTTDPFSLTPSAYITDNTKFDPNETTSMWVLPQTTATGRPTNPYYYCGGAYVSKTHEGSVTAALDYYNNTQTLSGANFSPTISQSTFLNLGAEIESSIRFMQGVKANKQYNIKITLNVPYQGTGYLDGSILGYSLSNYPQTTSTLYTTQQVVGAFTTPGTVLPVSLKSFVATKQGTSAQLNWVTASEVNNKGFYVQRSTDGTKFTNLGFVATQASGGNSTTLLNYSYLDATPGTGAVYYRLNQVDLDGTSKYSDVQSLFMGTSSSDVVVAPNPVISNVNLNNAQVGADYAIYSMAGQLVKSGKVSASVMSIDASNLPSGMYVIKTSTSAGAPVFKKFIKK